MGGDRNNEGGWRIVKEAPVESAKDRGLARFSVDACPVSVHPSESPLISTEGHLVSPARSGGERAFADAPTDDGKDRRGVTQPPMPPGTHNYSLKPTRPRRVEFGSTGAIVAREWLQRFMPGGLARIR